MQQVGDVVDRLHPTALLSHEVEAGIGKDAHDHLADLHLLPSEHLLQPPEPVSVVQQIVRQDQGAVEGGQRLHLDAQIGVAPHVPDAIMEGILRQGLIEVHALGDGVGDDLPGEDVAEGHAHVGPQGPVPRHPVRHPVSLADQLSQRLIEQQRVEGQQQLSGIEGGEAQAELDTGSGYHVRQHGVAAVGLLEPAQHVLDQDHRGPHIHIPQPRRPNDRQKAELGQQRRQGFVYILTAEGIGVVKAEAADQQLVHQELHLLRLLGLNGCDQQHPAGGPGPQKVSRLGGTGEAVEAVAADGPALRPGKGFAVGDPY